MNLEKLTNKSSLPDLNDYEQAKKLDLNNINIQTNSKKTLFKFPECTGYSYWTDCVYEYDCFSNHEESCENCLCNYKSTGGLYNPETGKKTLKIIALLKYGFVNHHKENI